MSCVIRTKKFKRFVFIKKAPFGRGAFGILYGCHAQAGGNALSGTAGMQADAVDVKAQLVHRPLPLFLVFGLKQQVR